MQNNKLDKIVMKTPEKSKAFFNWSHDVYSTAQIGEMQPSLCKLVMPKTKIVQSRKDLIRLAPMVAPAFTRMSRKDFYAFVPFKELYKNFAHMMAQTPISQGFNTYYPVDLPHMTRGLLSMLVLVGSSVSIWFENKNYIPGVDISAQSNVLCCPKVTSSNKSDLQIFFQKYIQHATGSNGQEVGNQIFYHNSTPSNFAGFKGTTFNPKWMFERAGSNKILGVDYDYLDTFIPIANVMKFQYDGKSFFDSYDYLTDVTNNDNNTGGFNFAVNTLEDADYVIGMKRVDQQVVKTNPQLAFAFKLSDFGKRLRKVLIGCGYQIDFESEEPVSLMPLFAVFKAYYELFGLKLYENYYTTPLHKLLTYADYNNVTNFDTLFRDDVFGAFITALGNMWMTEQQDYISAHITSTAVSPAPDMDLIDVPYEAHDGTVIAQGNNTVSVDSTAPNNDVDGGVINGHSYISSITHGQLDSEFIKRVYKWTNRNTVAGREVEKLLRAQGLGEFCDTHKSYFVGMEETPINVMDVVSTSDTINGTEGAALGEYAGRGLGWKKNKPKVFTYENDDYGYLICLTSIVPNAGFVQQLDPTLQKIEKFELYNPEFDGLGYEATTKSVVVGEQNMSWHLTDPLPENKRLDATFGFVPRYTGLKMCTSKLNGDFSRRSRRSRHLVYNSDRYFTVGEKKITRIDQQGVAMFAILQDLLTAERLPIAGNVWRYINRYAFMAHFERIFLNNGDRGDSHVDFYDGNFTDAQNNTRYEYIVSNEENFMLFDVNNLRAYWKALPVEKSFETVDEDEKPNSAMSKT